ncbi:hypothetical protein [Blastopirellula marina]|uniref:Uncharacterized protein n=1 Tax=Blastopirellula marina TaxID=124 RepID=A0A2S8GRC9_9BACT|nr:hypothetical protein [Blastopirellula marina]PQO46983.1 hypothetical protein C5Y93_05660 [Blastopirellula marina]
MPIAILLMIALGLAAIVITIAMAVCIKLWKDRFDQQRSVEIPTQEMSGNPFQSPAVLETREDLPSQPSRTRLHLEDWILLLGLLIGSFLFGMATRAIRPYAEWQQIHLEALASLLVIGGTWLAIVIYHRRDFGPLGHVLFQLENFAIWAGFIGGSTLVAGRFWGDLVLAMGVWGVGAAVLGSLLLAILHWRSWEEVPYKV